MKAMELGRGRGEETISNVPLRRTPCEEITRREGERERERGIELVRGEPLKGGVKGCGCR
jgi:hypothetical protein